MLGHRSRVPAVVISLLASVFFLAGCPKRPAPTTAAAPAPGPPPAGRESASAQAPAAPVVPGGASARPRSAAVTPPAPREFVPAPVLKDIHFDFDRYDIRPADARRLDETATWLKANANALILIEGHADERGTNEYNLALGERRARSTMNYLVSQGVQANRVTLISYGEERPQCTEKNETCWGKNRRAHFLVRGK